MDKAAFTFIKRNDRLVLVNPDGKMTEEQERLSQRGLSFVSERDGMNGHHAMSGSYDDRPAP